MFRLLAVVGCLVVSSWATQAQAGGPCEAACQPRCAPQAKKASYRTCLASCRSRCVRRAKRCRNRCEMGHLHKLRACLKDNPKQRERCMAVANAHRSSCQRACPVRRQHHTPAQRKACLLRCVAKRKAGRRACRARKKPRKRKQCLSRNHRRSRHCAAHCKE